MSGPGFWVMPRSTQVDGRRHFYRNTLATELDKSPAGKVLVKDILGTMAVAAACMLGTSNAMPPFTVAKVICKSVI